MNLKILIPLSAAVAAGGAAAWVGYELVSQRPAAADAQAPAVELQELVVAAHPLPPGVRLTASDVKLVRVEAGAMPDAVRRISEVIGRVLAESASNGQPITASHLAPPHATPGLSAVLPKGYRAITIEVNPYAGLEGFLQPEARVDVVATLRGTAGGEAAVRTVAQNLRVLAVSGRMRGQREEVAASDATATQSRQYSVTLLVTPEQAAAIDLACDGGTPRLALRAGDDQEVSAFEGLTLAELRGDSPLGSDAFASGEPAPSDRTIELAPTQVGTFPIEAAPAATQPAGQQISDASQPKAPARRRHIVEIIRGGVVTREAIVFEERPAGQRPVRVSEQAIVNNETKPADE